MRTLGRAFALDLNGIALHCEAAGRGYPLILIHGSAPGASSRNTWPAVFPQLARHFRLIATDLIGWGYSARKREPPYFDPDLWVQQIRRVIDRVAPRGPVGIIGHSLGGYVALRVAAADSRIERVLTSGALGAKYRSNQAIEMSWSFPQDLQTARALYSHVLRNTCEELKRRIVDDRMALMSAPGYGAYFSRLFAGPKQRYLDALVIKPKELSRIGARVALIYGKDDVAVPFDTVGLALAAAIPAADLFRLARCGHAAMIDAPDRLAALARAFFTASER